MGLVQLVAPPFPTTTRRCGSVTGNDLSWLSRSEKIAVFAPIPSASDRIATTVTMGVALRGGTHRADRAPAHPVRISVTLTSGRPDRLVRPGRDEQMRPGIAGNVYIRNANIEPARILINNSPVAHAAGPQGGPGARIGGST